MSGRQCHHPDIRKFGGVRCCLACGEAVFEIVDPNTIGGSSSASPSPYEYTPLNYKLGQEIRLLVVKPGEPSDRLQCDVIRVNLEDQPEYEAVSYTWTSDDQDATLSRSINCGNDRYIAITANCDTALRQLRRRGLKRRLWVDAVCINQTNIKERNHQVGLMDRIYSQARSVRICISDELFNYKEFFRWLQDTSTENLFYIEKWHCYRTNLLFSLRYFQRAWIIQEVVLAKTVYLLVNDDEILLSSRVIDRLSVIFKSTDCQLPGVLRIRHNKADSTPSINIVTCLRAGFTVHCTDARDKVFAVLSLMDTQARSLIPVDYSLDVTSVYASAVIAIVVSHGNLDILSYAGCANRYDEPTLTLRQFELFLDEKDQGQTTFLQSQFNGDTISPWRANIEVYTPNAMVGVAHPAIQPRHSTLVFCRTPHNYTSMNILPRLQLCAHFIDKIVSRKYDFTGRIRQVLWDSDEKGSASCIGSEICHKPTRLSRKYPWIVPLFSEREISVSNYSMYDSNWPPHTLWREDKDEDKDEDEDEDEDEVHQDEIPECNMKDLIAFATVAKARGGSRQMFLTRYSIGFANSGFETDDEIWAIDGARVPFILRKTGPNTYRIVRECYLWAALELDYWNPGTRKGRWSEVRPAHDEQQTHIIDVY
jgi:hypothetical protein